MNRKPGRPRQMPPKERQITYKQALKLIEDARKHLNEKGVTLGQLRNLVSEERLHRWGPPKMAILDREEVERVFGLVG